MTSVKQIHSTPNGDDLVAYMARVSNPSNQDNKETAPKLIRYLIKHKHWSPLEMVSLCVEIETTRSVAAQILRHRSFSFQEFSQRYAVAPSPVLPELRRQDVKNRQNSVDDLDDGLVRSLDLEIAKHFDDGYHLYKRLLDAGVAKECAREVLPLATPTRLYMHGTVRSWVHYLQLRCGNGTQLEHRLVAEGCREVLREAYPLVYDAVWGEGHGEGSV
jgi:thymidylate synthase (FAD)